MENSQHHNIESLYIQHHSWLHNWLNAKLGNRSDAADIAHDTFIKLILKKTIPKTSTNPRALITHVARCLVIDHWRRQDIERAYASAIAALPEHEIPSPETHHIIIESLLMVDTMLSELPALTKNIFLSAQLDGMKYKDIAALYSVSLPTVKRHMSKAFLACLKLKSNE